MKEILAVDFDGTLVDDDGTPRKCVIEAVNAAFDSGKSFVIIYTSRLSEDHNLIVDFLMENNVLFDLLETDKLRYDRLIDDRSVLPEEFVAQHEKNLCTAPVLV